MYHTPETLLNHVFEDLRKPKAPNNGIRAPPQRPCETSYLEFSETRPPLFVKAEDPLEADEWIRVMEQKF
jgi:hypothetical protein